MFRVRCNHPAENLVRKSTNTIELRASQHPRIHRYLHVGENRGKKKPRPRPRKTLNEKKTIILLFLYVFFHQTQKASFCRDGDVPTILHDL